MSTGTTRAGAATKPSSSQRRGLKAARSILGGATDVRAFAAGRVESAKMNTGAWWIVGIFGTVFAFFFLFLHVVLIPGALVLILLFESVKPKRGVAVTGGGVVEFKLSGFNGRPRSVMATTDHGVFFQGRARVVGQRVGLTFGSETILLRQVDYATLLATVPPVPPPQAWGAPGTAAPPPIPPPPPT